ncbi:Hypothetical protein SCF082_LOCUS38200 [Durusdinium trenchii]|uniref:ZZ-type domain-containing protein n=1 Tax=Durusdinium trenchii TaxID=1381693 RepID=A0ABP0PVP9_9DINO
MRLLERSITISVAPPIIFDQMIFRSTQAEVQIHGEVNLKKHVQRLVAASKYREVPKTQRSYAVRVTGPARVAGKYERMGAHGEMPLYKGEAGQKIQFDPSVGLWQMCAAEDDCLFTAKALPGVEEPPRGGWEAPEESWGFLPLDVFRQTVSSWKPRPICSLGHGLKPDKRGSHRCDLCGKSGTDYRCSGPCDYDLCKECWDRSLDSCSSEAPVSEEQMVSLLEKLQGQDSAGQAVVFRRRSHATLAAEWPKLGSALGSAEELWSEALEQMRKVLKEEAGLSHGQVLETSHPYDVKRFSWRKEVHLDGADALEIFFHSRSCTLDQKARFRTFTGGLRRLCAGKFSRVEVAVPGGSDKVWGTVLEREEGKWIVHLDTQEALGATEQQPSTWPSVGEEVEAKCNGVFYRATVAEVRDDGTYLIDWFDRSSKDREKQRADLRKPVQRLFDHRSLDDLPRFAAFQGRICKAICLDTPSSKHVRYAAGTTEADEQGVGRMVGDEIGEFGLDLSSPLAPLSIASFAGPGPAQEQGIEVGWYLDLTASLGASWPQLSQILDCLGGGDSKASNRPAFIEACFQNLKEVQQRLNEDLRKMRDLTLVFTNSCSQSQVAILPEAHVQFPTGTAASTEILQTELQQQSTVLPDTVTVSCHPHALVKFDNGSTTWYCDNQSHVCTRSTEGPKVRWSCRMCGYDQCRACVQHYMTSKPSRSPFTVSLKRLGKKGLVSGAGVRAGWNLDLEKTLHLNPTVKNEIPEAFETLTRFVKEADQKAPDEELSKKDLKKKRKKERKKKKAEEKAAAEAAATEPPPATVTFAADLGPSEEAFATAMEKAAADFAAFMAELEAPKAAAGEVQLHDREFTISLEEMMAGPMVMMETVGKKMEAIMTELGWSDPFELHMMHPTLLPEPVVKSASGEVVGPETMMMEISGDDPFGPGGSAEGKECPFPLVFTFKLPRKGEAPKTTETSTEAKSETEAKPEETAEKTSEEAPVAGEGEEEGAEEEHEEETKEEDPQDPKDEPNVHPVKPVTHEEAQESLQKMLDLPGICVAFQHPKPQSTQVHECFGQKEKSCWKHCEVAGDYAEFEFSTDGDKGDSPEKRWGVLALILPAPVEPEVKEKVESFLATWTEKLEKANGNQEQPQVEREGWDEARLRALCARHGWEFEWMTEDGERQRRARERWDVLKLTTTALPSDPAEPDGTTETAA